MRIVIFLLTTVLATVSLAADKDYNLFEKKSPDTWRVQKFEAPQMISPKNFSKIEGTAAQLQWAAIEDAQWYNIQVSWDPNFRFRLADEYVNDTNFTIEGLEPGKHYYWRVNAISNKKDSGYTIGYFNKATFDVK